MSDVFKKTFSAVSDGFLNMTQILPLAVSMCVCSAFSMQASLFSAILCCLAFPFTGLMPSYSIFIVIYSVSSFYGLSTSLAGSLICAVLLVIVSMLKIDNLKSAVYIPSVAAVMLGFTLYMTVMQTTNYFEIGATGRNVIEMMKSYRSLGFHGNWRGVLYGTIVLVIMIVYRRKFKNLSKKIPAAFWCFVITIPLNMILVPGSIITPISEVGSYAFISELISFNSVNILGAVLCGGAMLFIFLYKLSLDETPKDKKDILLSGTVVCISSLTGCISPCCAVKKQESILNKVFSAITGAVFSSLILIVLSRFIARTPIPTAAVILIIGMWQQNVWRYLKTAFTSGVTGIIAFIAVISVILLINPETGILITAFICAGYKLINKKKTKV